MKKMFVFISFLLSILVLSGCNTTNNSLGNGELSVQSEEEIIAMTEKGGKITCTMEIEQNGIKSSGILYINGDKVYTESKMNVMGKDIEAKNLILGNYNYSWTDDVVGTIFKSDEDEDTDDDFSFIENEGEYEEDGIIYKCKKGIPSNISFKVPSNIEFQEEQDDFDLPF